MELGINHLSDYIDGAFLKFGASLSELEEYITDCVYYSIRGVCVWPYFVKKAKAFLDKYQARFDTPNQPRLIAVHNFPHGLAGLNLASLFEFIESGVSEIDTVLNISAVKNQDYYSLLYDLNKLTEIMRTVECADGAKGLVKLIIHSNYLTDDELKTVGLLAEQCNIAYIKNSSGLIDSQPATIKELRRIRQNIPLLPVKMAGGITTLDQCLSLINNGASLLGISNFQPIMKSFYGRIEC